MVTGGLSGWVASTRDRVRPSEGGDRGERRGRIGGSSRGQRSGHFGGHGDEIMLTPESSTGVRPATNCATARYALHVKPRGAAFLHESGHDRILGLRHPVFLLDN